MSVGLFLGIKNSYTDTAQDDARKLIEAINEGLSERGVDTYDDPDVAADAYYANNKLGRSSLDHHSAKMIARLGEMANDAFESTHASLLDVNPYRLVFLPQELDKPLMTDHTETIWGSEVGIIAGSVDGLLAELRELAPELGIPLDGERLTDQTAGRIDRAEPLVDEEDDWDLVENGRTAWLAVYEAARLAREHDIALCLAG
ncbi:MAG: hypothetical protein ACQEVA_18925 [Myxococcota bacterium]